MLTQYAPPTVHSVWFEWAQDSIGEPDYMERSAEDHFGDSWSHVPDNDKAKVVEEHGSIWKACEEYARQDAQRISDFRAGLWFFESCRAVAEVRYEISPRTYRIDHLSSPGLGGIESDAGDEYRREVESEQLAELSSHLERFGILGSTSDHLRKLIRPGFPQSRWGDFVDTV